MIIGNNQIFAVEYETRSKGDQRLGFGKIWVQGKSIGAKEDLIFLKGYLLGFLDELINSKSYPIKINAISASSLFKLLKSNAERSEYIIVGSTFTDDFEIYSFYEDGKIFLVWKLRNIRTVFKELHTHSEEIQVACVDLEELKSVRLRLFEELQAFA